MTKGKAPVVFTEGVDNVPEIEAEKAAHQALAACVFGEHATGTTHEDAVAFAQWIVARGITSVIVVTTNIHMPRAIAELQGQISGVDLQRTGISLKLYDTRGWSHDPAVLTSVRSESVKYVAVRLDNLVDCRRS